MPILTTLLRLWFSGYGRRLTSLMLWVWITVPDTGWAFFHIYLLQKLYGVFEKTKINEKGTGIAHLKNKFSFSLFRIKLSRQVDKMSSNQASKQPRCSYQTKQFTFCWSSRTSYVGPLEHRGRWGGAERLMQPPLELYGPSCIFGR